MTPTAEEEQLAGDMERLALATFETPFMPGDAHAQLTNENSNSAMKEDENPNTGDKDISQRLSGVEAPQTQAMRDGSDKKKSAILKQDNSQYSRRVKDAQSTNAGYSSSEDPRYGES